jgi:hypothetical protein
MHLSHPNYSKMNQERSDWRLTNQQNYLMGEALNYKVYSKRTTKTHHDHCEFCFKKFAESGEDTMQEGYATLDDYRWICHSCFNDFKEQFRFKVNSDRV